MMGSFKERLRQLWLELNSSLWFVPGSMVLAAILLAIGLIYLESFLDQDAWQRWPLLFGAGRDGSREMLSAIASSVISVAGVVFSITIVVLSLASSQYTPRVLRNFMRDGTTQRVLGIFVGIYVYCLIVLRTIYDDESGAFLPHLAVLGGLVLALVSVGFLVYFIHHIALSIQASHILAGIAQDTERAIDELYPSSLAERAKYTALSGATVNESSPWSDILAPTCGYVQRIDIQALFQFAKKHEVIIRIERGVGDFVITGLPLFAISNSDHKPAAESLCSAFLVNNQRSVDQDVAFGIRQIVDIALKALSPGVNDPTTATMCIDRLEALLVRLAGRHIEPTHRLEQGCWYVIARGPTYGAFVIEAVQQITENAASKPVVITRLLGLFETLVNILPAGERRNAVTAQITATLRMVRHSAADSAGCEAALEMGNRLLER